MSNVRKIQKTEHGSLLSLYWNDKCNWSSLSRLGLWKTLSEIGCLESTLKLLVNSVIIYWAESLSLVLFLTNSASLVSSNNVVFICQTYNVRLCCSVSNIIHLKQPHTAVFCISYTFNLIRHCVTHKRLRSFLTFCLCELRKTCLIYHQIKAQIAGGGDSGISLQLQEWETFWLIWHCLLYSVALFDQIIFDHFIKLP